MTPFQENLVVEDSIEQPKDHIHHFGNNESKHFLTKDEHDRFVLERKEENNENSIKEEFEEYQKSYQNAMIDFQNQYNLRIINVVIYPPKKTLVNQTSANQSNQKLPNKDVQ